MSGQDPDKHVQFLKYYNSAQPLLRGWLLAWTRDFHRSEDLLQETSVVLWKRFSEFRSENSFEGWAIGITRNLALKALRQARVAPRLVSAEVLELVAATYERASPQLTERRNALDECLEKLSSALRKLVDLYFGESLSIAEVAQSTGRTVGGVKVSLFRARQWLANCTRQTLRT